MSHDRRPPTRRYPLVNGYRKPGRVSVKGSRVNDGDDEGGAAACGCIVLMALVWGAVELIAWIKQLFN